MYGPEIGVTKVEEQQQHNLPDDSNADTAPSSGFGKNLTNEDDMKAAYAIDSVVCLPYFFGSNISISDIVTLSCSMYFVQEC